MCSTVRKLVVLVVALVVLAIGMTGSWMMWNAVRYEDIDNDMFMRALAFLMLAITCWIPIQQMLKVITQNTKANAKSVAKSLIETTGKMLAFQQKEIRQQA